MIELLRGVKWLYAFLLIITLIICFLVVFFNDMSRYFFPNSLNKEGELLKVILTFIGGLVGIMLLFIHYKRMVLTDKGQIEDRFNNAVEHLGNTDNDSIVVGGAYSLHQVALQDFSYREIVLKILCAHIRNESFLLNDERPQKISFVSKTILENIALNQNNNRDKRNIYDSSLIDLSNAFLSYSTLMGGNFRKSVLRGAYLDSAILRRANLHKAQLVDVDFSCADLKGADLSHSNMRGALLYGTDLSNADLTCVSLSRKNCEGVILKGANLTKAGLGSINLSFVNLSEANLTRAYLFRTNLRDANFRDANLTNAYFVEADLSRTLLKSAKLSGANFSGAILDQAFLNDDALDGGYLAFDYSHMRSDFITPEYLDQQGAVYDENTVFTLLEEDKK
ncbi:pentapeptide repeat-containing protein [Aureibacter tunicatorum]|uniref:Uncharacterized protein YjbI with pentapeptide repeats n=1 Tax=Aureibacter tunicatorum TaxID=866807 RepID=A0AAE3XS03_9BACT|nr:pentapeptide repeat-containing protein [Aureibacter tunicatorum]MDR6240959.1 uncharacterized protein YjbI with pentapeptide repeats [Aureibacter tunicatorum]BDD03739.1 hypothetical protein AUTU_12220 [Aureibacter tunicatorum]